MEEEEHQQQTNGESQRKNAGNLLQTFCDLPIHFCGNIQRNVFAEISLFKLHVKGYRKTTENNTIHQKNSRKTTRQHQSLATKGFCHFSMTKKQHVMFSSESNFVQPTRPTETQGGNNRSTNCKSRTSR